MSQYKLEPTTKAGPLDPGRNLGDDTGKHAVTGTEIAIIVTTIAIFLGIVVTVFICRQKAARQKAATAAAMPQQPAPDPSSQADPPDGGADQRKADEGFVSSTDTATNTRPGPDVSGKRNPGRKQWFVMPSFSHRPNKSQKTPDVELGQQVDNHELHKY